MRSAMMLLTSTLQVLSSDIVFAPALIANVSLGLYNSQGEFDDSSLQYHTTHLIMQINLLCIFLLAVDLVVA
jgi:hypothetical protein